MLCRDGSREENASGPRHGDVGRPMIPPDSTLKSQIFPTRTELTPHRRVSRTRTARTKPTKEKAAAAKYFLFFFITVTRDMKKAREAGRIDLLRVSHARNIAHRSRRRRRRRTWRVNNASPRLCVGYVN